MLVHRASARSRNSCEHTIPRALGGRIRSRRVSSDTFNNATANRFDAVASADPTTGFLDIGWLLAGIEVWRFRLTGLWRTQPAFTVLAGCGTLRGTQPWAPVILSDTRWRICGRTEFRSSRRGRDSVAVNAAVESASCFIADQRHEALRRAVDLVDRRNDQYLQRGIISLTRFEETESPTEQEASS